MFTHPALLLTLFGLTAAENFEFQVSNPILLTSLRTFNQTPDDLYGLYVSKARNGSIILRAEKGYGIMAVVQRMNLQDLNSEFRTTCFDYLKISQLNGTRNTGEICGNSEKTNFVQPSFVDKSGETQLDYVLNEKIRLSPLEKNYTNFNVSFTPFSECPEDAFPFGNDEVRPCSTVDSFSCIPVEYFCDGVVNCGFPDEFALDEIYCQKRKVKNTWKVNRKATDKPKDEVSALNAVGSGKPFDPYVPDIMGLEVDFDDYELSTRRPVYFFNITSKGQIPLALVCLLTLLYLALVVRRRLQVKASEIRSEAVLRKNCDTSSALNLISHEYDEEADPAPSYEECVPLSPPFLALFAVESESPPSYNEIKVHKASI